jgi:hypothetical protein
MTPEAAIAALDRGIEQSGQTVTLRRSIGASPNQAVVNVDIRAMVRHYTAIELLDGLSQADRKIVISPTEVNRIQWPGGVAPNYLVDPNVPVSVLDRLTIDGRLYNVQSANPIKIDNTLVRIELQARG